MPQNGTNAIQDLVEQIALNTAASETQSQTLERLVVALNAMQLENATLRAEIRGQNAAKLASEAARAQMIATLVGWGDQIVSAITSWSNGPGARLAESKTVVIMRTTLIAGLGAFGGGVGTVLVGLASRKLGLV